MSSSLFILTPRRLSPRPGQNSKQQRQLADFAPHHAASGTASATTQHQLQCYSSWWASISTSGQYLYTLTCFIYEMWKLQTYSDMVRAQDMPKEPVCTRFHLIVVWKAAASVARGEWFRVLSTSTPGTDLCWSHQRRACEMTGCTVHGTRYTVFCAPLCHFTRFRHFSRVTFLLIFIGVGRSWLMASLLHLPGFLPGQA